MAPTVAELLGSPDHYLHSFDGDHALFVPMDRAAYRRSIFLDQRISPAGPGLMRVPVTALAQAAPAMPTNWIFHIAHCGSTLLARALDELGEGLVLREPLALRQLALLPDRGALLAPTLALLSRRYPDAGPTLIKANVPVNFMLAPLLATLPQPRAILLYAKLPDYLCAVLRSENHRRWVRDITALLGAQFGAVLPDSDAERAALLWLAQVSRFAEAASHAGGARTLEFEALVSNPARVLSASTLLFGTVANHATINRVVAGPLFNTYSKNPAVAFDNQSRLAIRAATAHALQDEIAAASRWLERQGSSAEALGAVLAQADLLRHDQTDG
jgi:hypothetical protein